MNYYITIKQLKVYAYHGVGSQEACVGNTFEIDATLEVSRPRAIDTDAIAHTINYADIVEIIKSEMKVRSLLLEHVAGRIRQHLTASFPAIMGGRITIWKLCPPISAELDRVGFTISW